MARKVNIAKIACLDRRDIAFIESLRRNNDANIAVTQRYCIDADGRKLVIKTQDKNLRHYVMWHMDYIINNKDLACEFSIYHLTANFVNKTIEFKSNIEEVYNGRMRKQALIGRQLFLEQKGNCFEMGIAVHILLASIGKQSTFVRGRMFDSEANPQIAKHAWCETVDIQTNIRMLIDPTSDDGHLLLQNEAHIPFKEANVWKSTAYAPAVREILVKPLKR